MSLEKRSIPMNSLCFWAKKIDPRFSRKGNKQQKKKKHDLQYLIYEAQKNSGSYGWS